VWEFVPAEAAGPYSRHDPVMPLKSYLAAHPADRIALTLQAGAWAHGLANRVPSNPEVAVAAGTVLRRLPATLAPSVFNPALPTTEARGVPVLAAESILVHMAVRPTDVRSWASAVEWLPDLAAQAAWDCLSVELVARPRSVAVRTGYLLQGLRPDLAAQIAQTAPVTSRVWFGPRGKMFRYDTSWLVADTLLPSDPRRWDADS
jgi:hypothetical protein